MGLSPQAVVLVTSFMKNRESKRVRESKREREKRGKGKREREREKGERREGKKNFRKEKII